MRRDAPAHAHRARDVRSAARSDRSARARARWPAAPRRRRSSGSARRRSSAFASARASPAGTSNPVSPVDHELGDAAHIGRDHRKTRGHRLEDGYRAALGPAGKSEHIRLRQQVGNVAARAGELHCGFEPELADLTRPRRPGPGRRRRSARRTGRGGHVREGARRASAGPWAQANRPTLTILGGSPSVARDAAPLRHRRHSRSRRSDRRSTCARARPAAALRLRHADGDRGRSCHEPVGPSVQRGRRCREYALNAQP